MVLIACHHQRKLIQQTNVVHVFRLKLSVLFTLDCSCVVCVVGLPGGCGPGTTLLARPLCTRALGLSGDNIPPEREGGLSGPSPVTFRRAGGACGIAPEPGPDGGVGGFTLSAPFV